MCSLNSWNQVSRQPYQWQMSTTALGGRAVHASGFDTPGRVNVDACGMDAQEADRSDRRTAPAHTSRQPSILLLFICQLGSHFLMYRMLRGPFLDCSHTPFSAQRHRVIVVDRPPYFAYSSSASGSHDVRKGCRSLVCLDGVDRLLIVWIWFWSWYVYGIWRLRLTGWIWLWCCYV